MLTFIVGSMKVMQAARRVYVISEPDQVDIETMQKEIESLTNVILNLESVRGKFRGYLLSVLIHTVKECNYTIKNLKSRIHKMEIDGQKLEAK